MKYLLLLILAFYCFNSQALICDPRISYCDRKIFITLCKDRTLSSSIGRGTCSYHGGIERYLFNNKSFNSNKFSSSEDKTNVS
jgi:hypothetical protein